MGGYGWIQLLISYSIQLISLFHQEEERAKENKKENKKKRQRKEREKIGKKKKLQLTDERIKKMKYHEKQ